MKELIKETRVQIDQMLQKVKIIPQPNRETALCYTAMQKGFMYLGLLLGAIGEANPYPESSDPQSKRIEEPTDKYIAIPIDINTWSDRIAAIKQLRSDVQGAVDTIRSFKVALVNAPATDVSMTADHIDKIFPILSTAMYSMVDAKLWLGQELNNIHEQQKKDEAIAAAKEEAGKKAYDEFYAKQQKPYDWAQVEDKEKEYWINTADRINNPNLIPGAKYPETEA